MFGTVKAPSGATDGTPPTKIGYFNLDRVTVQTKTFTSTAADAPTPSVGLVAGNADTAVVFEKVGVANGKITADAGNKINSKRALIGSVGDGSGGGDQSGGDLIIDPNAETNGFIGLDGTNYGDTLSASGSHIARVTGAQDGAAYYSTGSESTGSGMSFVAKGNWFHPAEKNIYLSLDNTPDDGADTTNLYTFDTSASTPTFKKKTFDASAEDKRIYELLNENIVAKYGSGGSVGLENQKVLWAIGNALKINNNTFGNDNLIIGDNGIVIPKGGVYFRPMFSGKVSALVYVPNPNNFSVGLFKLQRPTKSGTTETDYEAISGIERISEFGLPGGQISKFTAINSDGYDDALNVNSWSTTQIANAPGKTDSGYYFLFEQNVEKDEEYVIGQSIWAETNYFQTTFLYLVLPAVNAQGGGGLTGIDFVTGETGGSMWDEGYVYSGTEAAVTFELVGTAGASGFVISFVRDASMTPQVLYYSEGDGVTVTPSETDKCQISPGANWDAAPVALAASQYYGLSPPKLCFCRKRLLL